MTSGVFYVPGPKVIVVGDEAQLAAGREDAMEFDHGVILDDAAFVMSFLRPGIGEVEVDDLHDALLVGGGVIKGWAAPIPDKFGGIASEQFYIFEVPAAHAIGSVAVELAGPFDAEEVCLRLKLGLLEEEGALAGADLELETVMGMLEPLARVDAPGFGRGQIAELDAVALGDERFST